MMSNSEARKRQVPAPAPSSLTDAEREALTRAVCTLGKVECQVLGHNHARHLNRVVPAVERILAARLADQREQIEAELAHVKADALRDQSHAAYLLDEQGKAERKYADLAAAVRGLADEWENPDGYVASDDEMTRFDCALALRALIGGES